MITMSCDLCGNEPELHETIAQRLMFLDRVNLERINSVGIRAQALCTRRGECERRANFAALARKRIAPREMRACVSRGVLMRVDR